MPCLQDNTTFIDFAFIEAAGVSATYLRLQCPTALPRTPVLIAISQPADLYTALRTLDYLQHPGTIRLVQPLDVSPLIDNIWPTDGLVLHADVNITGIAPPSSSSGKQVLGLGGVPGLLSLRPRSTLRLEQLTLLDLCAQDWTLDPAVEDGVLSMPSSSSLAPVVYDRCVVDEAAAVAQNSRAAAQGSTVASKMACLGPS